MDIGNEVFRKGINSLSPKAAALAALPQEWRENLILSASTMGIVSEDDMGWLLVGSFINAWSAAAAAGRAAEEVDKSIRGIGDKIIQEIDVGTGRLQEGLAGQAETISANLAKVLAEEFLKGNRSLAKIFADGKDSLAVKLTDAASTLQTKAAELQNRAIQERDAIVEAGVVQAQQAVTEAIATQIAVETTFKRLLSLYLIVGAFVIGCIGTYWLLDYMDLIAPAPILTTAKGRPDCGVSQGSKYCFIK